MKLYVDDDSVEAVLLKLLAGAGHDVQVPSDVGAAGKPDPVHFSHAIREGRVLLTRNYGDFKMLHELVRASGGRHPGVIAVRSDNDRTRDLTTRGIVLAITKLAASDVPTADGLVILNHWR